MGCKDAGRVSTPNPAPCSSPHGHVPCRSSRAEGDAMGTAAHPALVSICPSIPTVLRGSCSPLGPSFPTLSPP